MLKPWRLAAALPTGRAEPGPPGRAGAACGAGAPGDRTDQRCSAVLGFSALRLGLASYVTAPFTLRIALILLWSVLLLGERPPRWRWLGVALLVLSAVAISR